MDNSIDNKGPYLGKTQLSKSKFEYYLGKEVKYDEIYLLN